MKRKTLNARRQTPKAEVKKQGTPNAEHATLNIEWGLHGFRGGELADSQYGVRSDRRYDLDMSCSPRLRIGRWAWGVGHLPS
jgi:hypothetical protein